MSNSWHQSVLSTMSKIRSILLIFSYYNIVIHKSEAMARKGLFEHLKNSQFAANQRKINGTIYFFFKISNFGKVSCAKGLVFLKYV